MTSITAQGSVAAAAFVDRLPTAAPASARPGKPGAETGDAIRVTTIGDTSAELAVIILDESALLSGDPNTTLIDQLHDSLEAAASSFGPGVTGAPKVGDASDVFSSPASEVFDILDSDGRVFGRLAVRVSRSGNGGVQGLPSRLHRIANVNMDLTVEVGHTRMAIREVMELEPGTIIELDRSAGAPADVKLNGRLIARGEIVVVDQDYAVRITHILESNPEV